MKKRIFIAINLEHRITTDLKHRLKQIQQTISDDSIRWIHPENIHLTLAFLGNIEEKKIRDLSLNLRKSITGIKPFSLQIKGLGFFPDTKRPRIVWLATTDHQELYKLEGRIKKTLDNQHLKYDRKSFRAHLTIARVKHKLKLNTIKTLKKYATIDWGKSKIKSIEIMSSRLESNGSRHTTEHQLFLN